MLHINVQPVLITFCQLFASVLIADSLSQSPIRFASFPHDAECIHVQKRQHDDDDDDVMEEDAGPAEGTNVRVSHLRAITGLGQSTLAAMMR